MRTLTILLILFCATSFAQDKAKTTAPAKPDTTVTLDLSKLQARFEALQGEVNEANKQIEAWTMKREQAIGKMQAIQEVAANPGLRVMIDTIKQVKKK